MEYVVEGQGCTVFWPAAPVAPPAIAPPHAALQHLLAMCQVRAYISLKRTWLCKVTPVIKHGVVYPPSPPRPTPKGTSGRSAGKCGNSAMARPGWSVRYVIEG